MLIFTSNLFFLPHRFVTIPPALGKSFLLSRADRRRKFSCSNHRARPGFWRDTASGSCALNHHVSMNLLAGDVVVDLKIDFANIDKASLSTAKLDRCFVVALIKLAVAI